MWEADKWIKGRKWNIPVVQGSSCDGVPGSREESARDADGGHRGFVEEAMSELMTCGQEDMGKACVCARAM